VGIVKWWPRSSNNSLVWSYSAGKNPSICLDENMEIGDI